MPTRQRRQKVIERDLSVPLLDISLLGTEDDPCFGKHYDLTAEECEECGDIEACSIVFLQGQTRKRLQLEQSGAHLDLEIDTLERAKQIRDFILRLQANGKSLSFVKIKTRARFKISKEKVKEIINNLKHGHKRH